MKKFFFLAAVALMSTAMYAVYTPATFENAQYQSAGIWTTEEAPYWYGWGISEENYWTSGDYQFVTYNDDAWGPSYYYDFVVSRDQSNEYTDYQHAYRSASGGAYEGDNFAVWYYNYYGNSPVEIVERYEVYGFYVNNCAYTVNSMCNVPGEKFTATDYLYLHCIAIVHDEPTDTVTVVLAGEGTYIDQWTYIDLSELGSVDGVNFAMEGSVTNSMGMVTPAYFCMDNFGATMPQGYVAPERAAFDISTSVTNTKAAVKATKVVRNGQVVIIRDNKAFNILGAEL